VTLEVDEVDAQKILLAGNIGRLSLILRQADEAKSTEVHRVTERDLTTAHDAPAVEPAPVQTPAPVVVAAVAPAPVRANPKVTIWLGMSSQEYEVPSEVKRN
jgi:pilus assembly protein CpaB